MNPEKLTSKFKSALNDAQSLALAKDHQYIEGVHLLAAMLEQQGGSIKPLLNQAGINTQALIQQFEKELDAMPSVSGVGGDVQVSNELNKLLNLTEKLALKRNDSFVASELFLLAALANKGQLAKILKQANITEALIEQAITQIRGGDSVHDENAEDQRNALKKYTIDLTERAEQGKLDPVIGRDDEIRRTIQVLQRRTKNNPVLIGEPGVGKTAIVEGLAQRIVNAEVNLEVNLKNA